MSAGSTATNAAKIQGRDQEASGLNLEALVRQTFDDIALIIGSAVTLHQLDDDLVWSVMKRLGRVRIQLFRGLRGVGAAVRNQPEPPDTPRLHVAIEEFLVRNRTGCGEGSHA